MSVVAVVGWKGGVGKTTVAMALAAGGGGVVLDADHQGSALDWYEMAGEGVPVVHPASARALRQINATLSGLVVVDTPPGHPETTLTALELADVAVCPIRPALADLRRLWPLLETAEHAGVPALVVLTMVRARTRSADAVRLALTSQGVKVANTQFPQREAISGAFGAPLPARLVELGKSLLTEANRRTRAQAKH